MQFSIKLPKNNKIFVFNRDRTLLLGFILAAMVLWLINKLNLTYTIEKEVEVHLQIPDDKCLQQIPDTTFYIKLKGSGWSLWRKNRHFPKIHLDYVFPENGKLFVSTGSLITDINKVIGSENLEISRITSDNFEALLVPKARKKVPVQLQASIEPAESYHLSASPVLQPDSITLSGPQSFLDAIVFCTIDSLKVSGIKKDENFSLKVKRDYPEVQYDYSQVQVHLSVEELTEKKLYVPVDIVNIPEGVDSIVYFPRQIQVSVRVGLSKYDEIKASDFVVQADLNDIELSTGKTNVLLTVVQKPDVINHVNLSSKTIAFHLVEKMQGDEE